MSESGGYNRYQGDYTGDLQGANQAWEMVAGLNEPMVAVMPRQAGAEASDRAETDEQSRRSEINAGGLGEGNQADALRQKMQALGAKAVERIESQEEMRPKSENNLSAQVVALAAESLKQEQESGPAQAEPTLAESEPRPVQAETGPISDPESTESTPEQVEAEKHFAEWQEWMKGTVDEFWDKLQNKEWTEYEGVTIGEQGPHFEELRERLMMALTEFNPQITPEALQTRLDMATKMAMEEFADRKAKALHDAKVQKSGFLGRGGYKRAIQKTYDRDLEKVLQGEVYDIVSDQYFTHPGLRKDMEQTDLPRREQLAWWKMMRPEEAQDLNMGWGERTPFDVIQRVLGEPPKEVEALNDYVSNLYGAVAERTALIPDEWAATRDKLELDMEALIDLGVKIVLDLNASFSTPVMKEREYYSRLVSKDTFALEKMRNEGYLPRTGEIAEQQAALDQVEENAIAKMAELAKVKQIAMSAHDEQRLRDAKIEYNSCREIIKDGFAARRALIMLAQGEPNGAGQATESAI